MSWDAGGLAAHEQLGRTTIAARIVDLDKPFEAEVDENEQRKDYTPSERVGIGEAREERDKAAAAQRRVEGAKKAGRGRKIAYEKNTEAIESQPPSREITAAAVGMSWPTYQKAKAVVKAAEVDPIFQPLVETMDRKGNVTAAWKRLPEDLRQPHATTSTPKAPPVFAIETILSKFDHLFHHCVPSFHTLDEEGVQQLEDLFAYFLQYIKAEAQGVAHGLDQHWSHPQPEHSSPSAGDVPAELRTSVQDDDAPRANLHAVAASMNGSERTKVRKVS